MARKIALFVRSRRTLVHAMPDKFKKTLPPESDRFFDAAEAGRYDEVTAMFKNMGEQRKSGAASWNGPHWLVMVDIFGAAEAAHDWPAQKLLDYGGRVLDSLRPGMIYAGGNDAAYYIPTLLNETGTAERPFVIITQNALADTNYLDYLAFRHGDRFKMLTKEDSHRVFKDYMADATRRLEHDEQFPKDQKQIRPGEDVRREAGTVQISGHVAVMALNEKLFQLLMQNNPGVPFAFAESFPFTSIYAKATTLGPIMELGVQNGLTAEQATQAVGYWREIAQTLLADPGVPARSAPRKAYAKLMSSHAGLFVARNYARQGEEALRIANEILPANPEVVFRLVDLLVNQGRTSQAIQVTDNAIKAAPENKQFWVLLNELRRR